MSQPADRTDETAAELALSIRVERTGGFAGLTRRWSATPPPDEADHWRTLIDACPWDAASPGAGADAAAGSDVGAGADVGATTGGADRFCWTVVAGTPESEHTAVLPETDLGEPWRRLIDSVREADAGRSPAEE
ncbi:hypothetical protein LJR045_000761 [Microbacterium sp. LjRoot45]|uniref:protealysin inhibitor emfourin n=1 Tax=Microbacterium sp. LjRoot45 TaxID=3342329 RepID=UPI003ECCBBEB